MSDMRHLITLVEGRQTVLMEGPIADKVKAVTKQVTSRYQDIKYDLLAKATTKALDVFQTKNKNPQAVAAIQKIAKVGKMAVQNRALLAVLVGMSATLMGLATNPTSASQAAINIDQTLDGSLDEIIEKLSQSGINVGDEANAAGLPQLPPEIQGMAQKAAKALHAIERFSNTEGVTIESSRELTNNVMIEGSVEKMGGTYEQHIVLKTPDGKLVLYEMHVTQAMDESGEIETKVGGVKDQLHQFLGNLEPQHQRAVSDYISAATGRAPMKMGEAVGEGGSIGENKAADIASLVTTVLAKKPDGKYKVQIGARGVRAISESARPAMFRVLISQYVEGRDDSVDYDSAEFPSYAEAEGWAEQKIEGYETESMGGLSLRYDYEITKIG